MAGAPATEQRCGEDRGDARAARDQKGGWMPAPVFVHDAHRERSFSMHVLLTGATGFIGSHLYRMLQNEGHTVRVVVRDAARAQRRWPDAESVTADFASMLAADDWR